MLLKPDVKLKRITDINIKLLKRLGVSALLLDVDNTLSTHHGEVLTDGLIEWIDSMQKNGIRLLVLSNSKERFVKPIADKIGLDYVSSGLKPLPNGFSKCLSKLNVSAENTAVVGDQIFTDVLGGNMAGVKTILLTPIKLEDKLGFRIKRKLEKAVFKIHKIKDEEI